MQKERIKNCRKTVLYGIGFITTLLGAAWLIEEWMFAGIGILVMILGIVFLFAASQTRPNTPLFGKFPREKFYRSLKVREGIKKNDLWKVVLDVVSKELDIDVIKKKKGYLRTLWKIKYRKLESNTDAWKYRSRIILKFRYRKWRNLRIKCESQYWGRDIQFGMTRKEMEKAEEEWIKIYDSDLLEDIYTELKRRIGVIQALQPLVLDE